MRGLLRVALAWALVLGWMGIIFWLSNQPDLPRLEGSLRDAMLKRVAHLVEYAFLGGLLWRALNLTFRLGAPGLYIWAFSLSFLYAVSDEVHQAFVPGRTASFLDLGLDALGILAVLIALGKGRRRGGQKG